jgi:hypothetical protein
MIAIIAIAIFVASIVGIAYCLNRFEKDWDKFYDEQK